MEKFTHHSGLVLPLDRSNVDTDAILPKQFLKSIQRTGFGIHLFSEWRYLDGGQPNPAFVLNQPRYHGASILLTRKNFGCGSSREHAAWALGQYGMRALIAPSFGDIFFENCFKNGLLPIVLPETTVNALFDAAHAQPGFALTIDLERQTVAAAGHGPAYPFEITPFRKQCLLQGLDEIGLTLLQQERIGAFEARRLAAQPWLDATL